MSLVSATQSPGAASGGPGHHLHEERMRRLVALRRADRRARSASMRARLALSRAVH
jgi:hypothetical protein